MADKFPVKVVTPGTSLGEFEVGDSIGIDSGGTGGITAPAALSNLGAEASANKGNANGYASLDGGGKIPAGQIPAVALPEVHVVADETARLALTVQEGDEAIQLDDGTHWIYDGTSWFERPQPTTFPLEIKDGGASQTLAAKVLNFIGFTITEPSTDEIDIQAPSGGGQSAIAISLEDGKAKDTFYTVMGTLIWPGSGVVGTPGSVTANMFVKASGDEGDFRLFDATNGLAIAEVLNIVSDDVTDLIDLGSLSNISAGEALWELQGLESTGDKGAEFNFLSMTINL